MVRHSSDLGLDERDSKVLQTLEEWGWFVTKVLPADGLPGYSMGLYKNFGHPEVIVLGLDLDLMHRLINSAAEQIRHGQRYEDGYRYGDLLKDYACEFRRVEPARYRGFVNYSLWYYEGSSFPLFQLVWPDKTGLFPWDPEFDKSLQERQLKLY